MNFLKKTFSFILALMIIITTMLPAMNVFAETNENEINTSSVGGNEPIIKKRNAYIRAVKNENAKILLVEDNYPWDSSANSIYLDAIGEPYNICGTGDILTEKLWNYQVVIFANDQGFSSYENYSKFRKYIELFLQVGGVVIFGACDSGWAGGSITELLPGGVKKKYLLSSKNYIVDQDHDIVTGVLTDNKVLTDADLYSNYCSHNTIVEDTLPAGSNVILRSSNDNAPTLVEYPLDKGLVILSTLTWEHNYNHGSKNGYGDFAKIAMEDMFRYAIGKGKDISNASSILESYSVSKDDYGIMVIDSKGNAISGATVKWNNEEQTTDETGLVVFNKLTVGEPKITVTKNGYQTYSNENTNYSKSEFGYDVITLYSEKEATLLLKSAQYKNGVITQDILRGSKKINIANQQGIIDNEKFSMYCSSMNSNEVSRYEIRQENKEIASSTTGEFPSLTLNLFEEKKDVYIRIYGKTGEYVDNPINLIVEKNVAVENLEISFGDSFKVAVPDGVPFIGNTTIDLDIPDLPFEFYVDNEKLHVGVNFKLYDSTDKDFKIGNEFDMKKCQEAYRKDIKETMDLLKGASKNYKKSSDWKKINANLKKYLKSNKKMDIPMAKGLEVTFVGYGEGNWSEKTASINLYLLVDASLEKTWQTVVWVIPVVVNIKVGVNGKLSAEATYDFDQKTLNGDITANISPYLEAFGGAGIGKAIGVGAYGEANIDVELQIVGTQTKPGVNSVDLTGELGVSAYFIGLEYKRPFAYNTWHIYSRTKNYALRNSFKAVPQMYEQKNFTKSDLSYLKNESEWYGEYPRIDFFNSLDQGAEFGTLLTETYRNSQPKIISSNNTTLMAFIRGNTERATGNEGQLVFSVYDQESDIWSSPIPVDSDDTFDSNPYLYSYGDDIYITYMNSDKSFDNSSTIEEIAFSQQIVVGKYNPSTNKFENLTTLSQSNCYNSVPKIAVIDNTPVVIWQSNENSDIFGLNQTNKINYSYYKSGTWSNPISYKDNLNTITGLSIGKIGDVPALVYIVDNDNDLETVDDKALYINNTLLTVGNIASPMFEILPSKTKYSLLFSKDDTLMISNSVNKVSNLGNDESLKVNGDYKIIGNRILYIAATQASSNVFSIVYDEKTGKWSSPVQLTFLDNYISEVSFEKVGSKILSVMLLKDVEITDDDVIDSTTLSWCEFNSISDISIDNGYIDNEKVIPNNPIPLEVDVTNKGDQIQKNVHITITDEKSTLYDKTLTLNILPGKTETLKINLPSKKTITYSKLKINVSPENASDYNDDDNSYQISYGYTDLVTRIENYRNGNNNFIMASIKNESYTSTKATVEVYNDYFVEPIQVVTTETLAPNASHYIKLDVNDLVLGNDSGKITFVVKATENELITSNNNESTYFDLGTTKLPERIEMNKRTLDLHIGQSEQLSATVFPENVTDKTIMWKSNNEKVATVSSEGVVTAISGGTATISVISVLEGIMEECVVTVESHKRVQEKTTVTKATLEKDGEIVYECDICSELESETVYKPTTFSLSTTIYRYDGKVKSPTVTVKDSKSKTLKKDVDYTVTYASGRKNVGKYAVTVNLIGNYSGTKTLYFNIVKDLSAPKTVKASLYGYDDVKVSWSKVSGATAYKVYYKISTAKSYTYKGTTKSTSMKIANLADGKKYTFKVVPCTYINGSYFADNSYKTTNIYTTKNLSASKTVKASLYGYDDVKVSWSKVSGATAYKVYYKISTAKSYTYKGTTKSTSMKIANLADGKKYTFKVVPCTYVNGSYFADSSYKTAYTYTLKKMATPKVAKYNNGKVKVSFTNIAGESGYQISKSTTKTGTSIVSTYATTSGKSKVVSATKGKTYYYKIRAYKVVNGKKIYGPWSSVKTYKLK